MDTLWIVMAGLVLVAGILGRRRLREIVGGEQELTDAEVERIERMGELEREDSDGEPLDMDAIEEAEEEFWNQSWDEPERWSNPDSYGSNR